MKKTTLKLFMIMFLLGSYVGVSQTLNQNASWPNPSWALTGTYNADPLALEADPTVSANFAFDDDDAGNGSDDDIAAESPVIDLTAAHTAGETWITISGNFVYNWNTDDILQFEYWDADAMTWNIIGSPFNADTPTPPTNNFCTGTQAAYTTDVLNIAGFTVTQLSGFRYRIYFDDLVGGAGFEWGFCFDSPTITSVTPPSCPDPSALGASNIDGFSADLAWTETGSATAWNIELVDITGGGAVTGTATATGVANPYNQSGLDPSTNYEYYVQADCGVDGTSAWVGPFAFTTTVECPAPSGLTATNFTTTGADFSWTAGASETVWDIEIVDVTAGGTATGTPTASGVANPYTYSSGVAANSYQYYVRADCASGGGSGISTWVGPFAFTTACNVFTAPYTEDFENAGALPACWSLGGDENWLFQDNGPNHVGNNGTLSGTTDSGNYYAVVDDSTPDAANAQLDSPLVDVSGLTTPALSFYEISNNEGQQNATLTVSVWDGAAWNVVGTYNTNTAGWEQKIIDLSGLTFTGPAQARFSVADSGNFYDDIAIDDVTFGEAPSCFDPSALAATSIDGFSADLGWTENGTATLWNIELVDITGGGAVTGTATASGVTNPYNQSGLDPSTNYEYYVQADCGVNGTSAWVGPFAFSTTVACPDPTALTATNISATSADLGWTAGGSETLWDVEIVDITGGGAVTGTATASGVANPYNATGLTDSNAYEFYVRADCVANGTSAWAGPFAFTTACTTFTAPYTQDFENAGAVPVCWTLGGDENWLFNTAGPNHVGNGGTLSGSTASGGYYAVVDDSTPDAANAQLDSPFVDVSGLTTPSLSFYEISDNEGFQNATLTVSVWDGAAWNVVGTYNTNTSGWEQKIIDLSGLTFTGPAQARFSVADSGNFYDDIAIDDVTFDELPTCIDPSILTATNITDASADLGWTENGTATLWNIEIVDVTGGGTVTGTATATGVANPYAATGLAQNNNYAFYVQADCGPGGLSGWAGPFAFTTAETCPAPGALTATTITETTADLGWTENGAATSWNIELVDITAGGTATGTATASGVMNPYAATGLVGDNTYQFYVQADCGVDGVSAWAGPFTFATPYVAVPPNCTNGTFLDSGGQSGDYSTGENITYTICPDNPATETIEVVFNAFSTENNGAAACYDGLTIHNGPDATAATIDPPGGGTIWCWDEDDIPAVGTGDLEGMMIESTDPTGCLTFVFTSDGSVVREGWEAVVNCNPLSTVSFENGRAFTFYPNPVDNKLTLVAGKRIENVTIHNILGAQVLTTSPNSLTKEIDTSALTAGTYFVQVTVDGVTDTVKVIKQ